MATYYYAQSIGGDEVAYLAPSYRAKIKKSAFWSKLPSNVTLRILGTGPNADLIVESAGHLLVGHIAGLELHGPRGIPANAELDTLLECSSKFPPLARSLGGWHAYTERDHATYLLASKRTATHPLFERLSFYSGLDTTSLTQLISSACDPRWFVDEEHPNRNSAWLSYFGLAPRRRPGAALRRRAEAARRAWTGLFDPTCSVFGVSPTTRVVAKHPRFFLWREALSHADGDRAATTLFLEWFRQEWLQFLYEPAEPRFVPEFIFEPDVAEAYRAYAQSWSVVVA